MNPGRFFSLKRTLTVVIACATFTSFSSIGRAADPAPQKKDKGKAAASSSKINEEYSAKNHNLALQYGR